MYEYNEHNESLFSGAIGAAQHINITTLFSGVRTVIRHLIFSGASAVTTVMMIFFLNMCSK